MQFTKLFKGALLASTSALGLTIAVGDAHAQGSGLLGLYGGVGLGWENGSGTLKVNENDGDKYKHGSLAYSGLVGNLFGGYRMALSGPWVVGAEAKFTLGGNTGTLNAGPGATETTAQVRSKFGFGLAATIGYLMPNGMLPFAKIGYAGKSVKFTGSIASAGSGYNSTKWNSGIEFGAGIDMPIASLGGSLNMPLFLRADASYTAMFSGGKMHSISNDTGTVNFRPNVFQAGLSVGLKF